MQCAKGKIEIFTHIYKLGLVPCSLASGSLAAAAIIHKFTGLIVFTGGVLVGRCSSVNN